MARVTKHDDIPARRLNAWKNASEDAVPNQSVSSIPPLGITNARMKKTVCTPNPFAQNAYASD